MKNINKKEGEYIVGSIEPPRRPSSRVKNDSKGEETLPPIAPKTDVSSKEEKKKSFFSNIFKLKEKKVETENKSSDLPFFGNEINSSGKDNISQENKDKKNIGQETKKVKKEDIENIRAALGITQKKDKSVREKFEEDVSKDTKKKKKVIGKSSESELTDILLKHKIDVPKKSVKKTKSGKKSESNVKVKPNKKVKNKSTNQISSKVFNSKAKEDLEKIHGEIEKTKTEMLADVEKRKPEILKAKAKIKAEFQKYEKKIKDTIKKDTKEFNSYKTAETKALTELRKKIKQKQLKLDKRQDSLTKKELSVAKKEQNARKLMDKVDIQSQIMEKFSQEIDLLDADIKKNANLIETQKVKLEKMRSEILQNQHEAKEKRDDLQKAEKEFSKRMKKIDKETSKANLDLENIQKKSLKLTKQLEEKEKSIDEKEKEINKLLEDEKKIADFLKNHEDKSVKNKSQVESIADIDFDKQLGESSFDGDFGETPLTNSDDTADIEDKINDCKQLLEDGEYEDAKLLYNELRNEFIELKLNEDESKNLKSELKDLYDDICLKILRGN